MPLTTSAAKQLRDMLRDFRAAHSGVALPTGQGKALEAWVLMKLAHTVKKTMSATWAASLRLGDGSALPAGAPFDLTSHGSRIQPSASGAPGFVLLEHKTHAHRRLELRGSVRWEGRSGAKHECDISVLPASIGEAIRNNGGGYPRGLPIALVECKDKSGLGNLDETRQTLARMYDLALVTQPALGPCRIYEVQTGSSWGSKSSTYVAFFAKGTFGIVRAGGFQTGTQDLATHYHVKRCANVYSDPGAIAALQAQFRTTVASIATF